MKLRKLLALTLTGGLCFLCAYGTHSFGRNRFQQVVRLPSQNPLLEVEKLSDLPLQRPNEDYQVQFISANFGWLYTGKSIWRTQDGGRTWTLIFQIDDDPEALKKGEVNQIAKLQFINERIGWMSMFRSGLVKGEDGSVTFTKSPLLKSEDGGLTWHDCLLEFQYIADFCFLTDGQKGYVAGSYWDPKGGRRGDGGLGSSHLFQTTNGGKTWLQPASGPRSVHIAELVFIDEDHGWVLFPNGIYQFEHSRWTKKLYFREVYCGTEKTFRGSDDPADLEDRYTDQGVPLSTSLFFINANEGWAGFINGDLLHTTDGGQSWCSTLDPSIRPKKSTWVKSLSRIYFSDSRRGWMLNEWGELYKTEDGGITMVRVNAGVRIDYMHFLNAQCGWVVAKEGVFRLRP